MRIALTITDCDGKFYKGDKMASSFARQFIIAVLFSHLGAVKAQAEGPPIEITIDAFPALCRTYEVALGSNLDSAASELYQVAITAGLIVSDTPQILFKAPIGPDDDTDEVINWSICAQIAGDPISSASVPGEYELKTVPSTRAISISCLEEKASMCDDELRSYLGSKKIRMTRLPIVTEGENITHLVMPIE